MQRSQTRVVSDCTERELSETSISPTFGDDRLKKLLSMKAGSSR